MPCVINDLRAVPAVCPNREPTDYTSERQRSPSMTARAASIFPEAVETWMPCTILRRRWAISRAMTMPSAAAASCPSARRRRSISDSGTRTPGTSFAMNSAFRTLSNGKMPATTGSRAESIRFRTRSKFDDVEDRPRQDEFGARFDLVVEPAQFLVEVRGGRVEGHADVERGRRADGLAADVAAVVQARDDVGQTDRIDVEHRGRVGIVADAARIAGDEQQVAQAEGVRAQQIGLDAQQIPIPAGVVQQRLDARLLLDEHGKGQRAQTGARAKAVRDVHDVHAVPFELAGALDRRLRFVASGRQQFDGHHERAARELPGQPRFLLARHRRSRDRRRLAFSRAERRTRWPRA